MYILLAILGFGILIAVHEFGHFAAAKACGVRVEEFSIGMGPALWKKQKGETLYALRALPIGGYCAMTGENEAVEGDERAFSSQPAWKRLIILVAGSFMNFLIGLVLLVIVFSSARAYSTPVITEFFDGCPYESADGLQVGDQFYKIDGHRIYFSSNVSEYLARGSGVHDIVVIRDGEKVELKNFELKLLEYPGEEGQYYGFRFGVQEMNFGQKLQYSWYCAIDFVRMVYNSLRDLFAGVVGVKDLSGPVGIVSMINDVGQESSSFVDALLNIAYFMAFIAVNLAVMNMLPIPALDGGRVFLLVVTWIVERIIRKKVDPRIEGYIHTGGMVLLLALMAFVMYQDIFRIVTK